jgi:hypothetical protein
MIRRTTKHNDETQEQKTNHGYNLDGGEDKLSFSVDANGEDIQGKNEQDDERDPDCWIVLPFLVPEIDEESSSRDLSAERDGVLVPIYL